uniref:Uncharacterized protein n=1 Tax=Romanomermis culicivorax TaxID=13658 RepID=A0A915IWL2_ROMCU
MREILQKRKIIKTLKTTYKGSNKNKRKAGDKGKISSGHSSSQNLPHRQISCPSPPTAAGENFDTSAMAAAIISFEKIAERWSKSSDRRAPEKFTAAAAVFVVVKLIAVEQMGVNFIYQA